MRNFNTSFAKNAIRIFANEASQVLRAFSDPATSLLRLIKPFVWTVLDALMPISYRLRHYQCLSQTDVETGMPTIADRYLSVQSTGYLGDERGTCRSGCRLSLTAS